MPAGSYMFTYLGIFDKIAEWIFGGIAKALSWLFNKVFGPVFEAVLEPIATQILEMLKIAVSSILYEIFRAFLRLIDVIQQSFEIFGGVTTLSYTQNGEAVNGYLTDMFFENSTIGRAFWTLTVLALFMCAIFTVAAVTRTTFEIDAQRRTPLGQVLTNAVKSMLAFLIVPAICLTSVSMSNHVVSYVSYATSKNENGTGQTIAMTLFETCASAKLKQLDDNKVKAYKDKSGKDPRLWDSVYRGSSSKITADHINYYIDFWDVDYVLAFGSSIFLIWNLVAVSFAFVQRLFELLLLYLASPFFAATMPLDNGERFKKWQSMFIAKLAGGIGMIVMVNLYLILVPLIMDGTVNLAGGSVDNASAYDTMIKLIFVLGAALAVKNGGSLVTMLIDSQAGMSEQSGVAAGMAGVAMAAGGAFNKAKQQASGRKEKNQQKETKKQQFKAKQGGKDFVAGEKKYGEQMKRADYMEASGDTKTANQIRSTANVEREQNMQRAEKQGYIKRDSSSEKGFHYADEGFKHGAKISQHKEGPLSASYKFEKVRKGREKKERERDMNERIRNVQKITDKKYTEQLKKDGKPQQKK